ncbi:MAG: hypothetical protein Q7V05_12900 [Methanoregula sp.]|nr:hypothetical protein [Methanoregula sp.]
MVREWIFRINLLLCVLLVLASSGCVTNPEHSGQNIDVSATREPILPSPTRVLAISAGITHSLALREDGTVKAWGSNSSGQCGVPKNLTNVTGIAAGDGFSIAVKTDGTVIAWGCAFEPPRLHYNVSAPPGVYSNGSAPCEVPENVKHIRNVSAGIFHVLALVDDGSVVAWGINNFGQCDIPPGLKNVTAVSAGDTFSMALRDDGSVAVWGWYLGRIPQGTYKGIAAGYNQGMLLKRDGTLASFTGAKNNDVPLYHPLLTNVTGISAGHRYFLALLENGSVVEWGYSKTSNYDSFDKKRYRLRNITAISSQSWQRLALRDDGTVIEWRQW